MGWFSRKDKAPAGPTEAELKTQQDQKDKESIFNDARFMKFVDSDPSLDVDSNLETLKKSHEAFKSKEKVSKEIQTIIKDDFKKDIGLSFDKDESGQVAEAIDKYLEQQLIESPERISELSSEIAKFRELNEKVTEQNKALEKLGGMEKLRAQQEAVQKLASTKKSLQFMRRYSTDHKAARESATENGIDLANLKNQSIEIFRKFKEGEKTEVELNSLLSNIKDLRGKIFDDLEPMESIRELQQNKVDKRLKELTDPANKATKKVKGLDETRAFIDKLTEKGEYLPEGFDLDSFTEEVDNNLDKAFTKDLKSAVENIKDGSLTLNKMKEVLKPVFKREKLGGKTKEETETFIVDYINDKLMDKLPKSKQILLKFAMESFNE